MQDDGARRVIDTILKKIFYTILDIEEKTVAVHIDDEVTITEMHIIEAVGETDKGTMGYIARKLRIKTPSLTVTVNKLAQKGFIDRFTPENDRRKVYLQLTERGQRCFELHKKFHEEMVDAVVGDFKKEDLPYLEEILTRLKVFFEKRLESI
jgi:DNA-binding MarR family transcriptional regulator